MLAAAMEVDEDYRRYRQTKLINGHFVFNKSNSNLSKP